jgi:ubiquitin-protein ligase E3 C
MFTTFSGNTKRPRNVNLGGRKTHAFGSSSSNSGAGSQAALDRAQQDRVQRQREREELKAAHTIQKVWRGHSSRQRLAGVLRREWDADEGSHIAQKPATAYSSQDAAYTQLRRLIRFVNTRDQEDVNRIQHFISRQVETVQQLGLTATGPWPSAYLRLETMTLTIAERQMKDSASSERIRISLGILRFVAEQIPSETSQNAERFYSTLAKIISTRALEEGAEGHMDTLKELYETVISPLKKVTGYTLNAYEAFGYTILSLPALSADTNSPWAVKLRDLLADSINYKLLANALATSLKQSGLRARQELADTTTRLQLLGSFIYFHRFAHNFHSPEAYSVQKDFVTVVSPLLNSLPSNMIERSTSDGEKEEDAEIETVNAFMKEQIMSLVNQEGIGNLLAGSSQSSETSEDERIEESRQLANYALALLRFFPRRGDEIRMWLYMGPSDTRAGKSTNKAPAIRYFWEASKRSSVFKTISRDSRAAVNLLRQRTAQANPSVTSHPGTLGLTQHTFWQAPQQEIDREAITADEWRVILVFLELYTFVLKVTDDEEFFSGGQDIYTGQVRDNSLPLAEVKDLTLFLKNLGFTLYFNASDITAQEARESNNTGFGLFAKATEPQQQKTTEPSIGGVAGLNLDHVKGLVTGLLRMVYERDSRRKFLSAEHWLMTSRFDMTSFIPQVVVEEENRHKLQEEDADDVEEEEEELVDTPRLIGNTRTQYQLRQERIARQQRKLSRMRYLQKVAPRLEILQNMPFFIPFTTRVQIFREFVGLDMVSLMDVMDRSPTNLC